MTGLEVLDLIDRLTHAEAELLSMADQPGVSHTEVTRLLGKRQGVALARSYVEEMLR